MYFILKTKYTLSLKFVPAQVRGNNHWSTSQVRANILNYRTLLVVQPNNSQTNLWINSWDTL
jgi:hypothetical protein